MTINMRDVGSGYKRTSINSNFQDIETEINNNLLSKNGGVGLEADLDANSQKVINLADGIVGSDAVNLRQLNGAINAAGSGLIAAQTEAQLGSEAVANVFTLSSITYTVGGNNLYVFRNGQKLGKGEDYTETSTSSITLTFTPNGNDRFEFITNISTTNSITDTAAITHSEDSTIYNLATYLQNRHIVNVKDFGAVGDGVTDDIVSIKLAVAYAVLNSLPLYFPPGHYRVSDTIAHITNTGIASPDTDPYRNGLQIIGAGSAYVTIEALPSLGNKPIIKLDGNGDNHTTVSEGAVAQAYSVVQGVRLRGHTWPGTGLYPDHHAIEIRALWNSRFSDLILVNTEGDGIHINGTTVSGEDDTDTTIGCTFENIFMRKNGVGFNCSKSRASLLTLTNVTSRYAKTVGIKFSAINSSLNNCFAVLAGHLIPNLTAIGLYILNPQTGAKIRNIELNGCGFDANTQIDLNIENVDGLKISACNWAPYFWSSTSNKRAVAIGLSGSGTANNITFDACRLQQFADTYGDGITAFDFGANANNIHLNNVSIDPLYSTGNSTDFKVNPSASNIRVDGHQITRTTTRPSFSVTTVSGADLANLTGDGTEIVSSALGSSMVVEYDHGSNLTTPGAIFTAPHNGLYEFNIFWEAKSFTSSHNEIKVGFIKNEAGSPVRYNVDKQQLISPLSTNHGTGGTLEVLLDKGDTMSATLTVSGGTKVVDIPRTINPASFRFRGKLL